MPAGSYVYSTGGWDVLKDMAPNPDRRPAPITCACGIEVHCDDRREQHLFFAMHLEAAERRGDGDRHHEECF